MDISNVNTRHTIVLVVVVGLLAGAIPVGVAQEASDEPDIAEAEPNDGRQNATPITDTGLGYNGEFVGGDVSGSVTNSDVDWFKFTATEGQAINYYAGSFGFSSANVTLYGPNGQVGDPLATGGADIFTAGAVANETGAYYFRVSQTHSSERDVGYEFTFEIAEPEPFEPNDGIESATPIESGTGKNGTVTEQDTDVFAVEADAAENITASVALRNLPTDNPNNVVVDVLDSNGDRISESSTSGGDSGNTTELTGEDERGADTAGANATIEEAGTYYVRVKRSATGLSTGGFAAYELDVNTNSGETTTGTPDADAFVITGGSPGNKLDYTFTTKETSSAAARATVRPSTTAV